MGNKDRVSGSLEILKSLYREFKQGNLTEKTLFEKITVEYPSFAVLYAFYDFVASSPEKDVSQFIDRMELNRKRALHKALTLLEKYRRIFTYSRSSQVKEVLENLKPDKVFITESRPKNEGTLLAEELVEDGIDVVLGIDMMLEHFIKNADCVALGSDAVFENSFVNKIGSGVVVKIARTYNKPVYVLSVPEKKIKEKYRKYFRILREPSDEVISLEKDIKSFEVVNLYFEEIPLEGVKLIV